MIEGKLAQMPKVNSMRVDLAEKFQKLIDAYNAGSQDIEDPLKELVKFARELTAEKQQARAAVMQTIELGLRKLPPPYTRDLREEQQARTYAHVYDHYFGAGQSVYQAGERL